jgi:hypothetical protein
MGKSVYFLIILNILIFKSLLFLFAINSKIDVNSLENDEELHIIKNCIKDFCPGFLTYPEIINQLKVWNEECPDITEFCVYGKSSKGEDLCYIRIKNRRFIQEVEYPKVLITGCIHGNEPLSTATIMWYIGNLLNDYNSNLSIRELLDTRDIYFVPVVSPDSYPNSRYVDGFDPNRVFDDETIKISPVSGIKDLFKNIKPQAVISGHTWGRVFLTPYGDNMNYCPDHDKFKEIVGKMSELSGYRNIRACDMYRSNGKLKNSPIKTAGYNIGEYNLFAPIHGTEIDWYYRNNSFAIIMEFGTHQRIPTYNDIKTEFDKTYNSIIYFIKEAPLVKLSI